MIRTLQSPWIAAVIGMVLYLATTALLLRPDRIMSGGARPVGRTGTSTVEPLGPSWTFKNPELDQLVSQLVAEREAVRAKEKDLSDLANRLALERQEIGTITQRVAVLQREMDRTFVRIQDEETANLKRLAKVYATMAPESAAKIFLEFQDEASVKIFAFMKESEVAPVLENMAKTGTTAARRVALISDRLRLLSGTRASANPAPGATTPATPAPAATPTPTPTTPPPSSPPATKTP
jgi:flagellar motility protein MotE (MotC chaperone)